MFECDENRRGTDWLTGIHIEVIPMAPVKSDVKDLHRLNDREDEFPRGSENALERVRGNLMEPGNGLNSEVGVDGEEAIFLAPKFWNRLTGFGLNLS